MEVKLRKRGEIILKCEQSSFISQKLNIQLNEHACVVTASFNLISVNSFDGGL